MLPDPKWLDILKLPLPATIAVALSSTALFVLDIMGLFNLGPLNDYTRPVLIFAMVMAWVLTLVRLFDLLVLAPLSEKRREEILSTRRAVRRDEKREELAEQRQVVLARLDHLSAQEIHYVAKCLRDESPTFYTYVHSPPVTMLQGKQLVWTPGGTHHQDHYPFSFYDYVWETLLERQDEFQNKDDEHKRAEEAKKEAQRRKRGY